MTDYRWHLACGEHRQTGQAPSIAEGLAGLHGQLHHWAATALGDEVEGSITGPAGDAPFWLGWGPLSPACGGTSRAADTGPSIDELIADLRVYLHWLEDQPPRHQPSTSEPCPPHPIRGRRGDRRPSRSARGDGAVRPG